MPQVRLFGNLRKLASTTTLEFAGDTVREVILALCAANEDLCGAILDDGHLRPHVRVMVAGRDVVLTGGLDTPVGEADQIAIFPPIAGG